MTQELLTNKIISLFVMLGATLACGLIPRWFVGGLVNARSSPRWRLCLTLMNCFSGGIFLAACLIDLLPHVREDFEDAMKEIKSIHDVHIHFPMAEFFTCVGFFLVLIMEQAIASCKHHSSITRSEARPFDDVINNSNHADDASEGHNHAALHSLMLLIALTFHSILEGLSIGLQKEMTSLVSIFIAVIVHKCIMALSFGLTLAQSGVSARFFFASVLVFSLSSPIGIAIGIGMDHMKQGLYWDIASGILQGLACGTFLHITFFEILPKELKKSEYPFPKIFAIIFGFLCLCGLLIIAHDD